MLYGAYVTCKDYDGEACDFGPDCDAQICFDPRLKSALQLDKSLILSALELSDIAYVLPHDVKQREKLCHNVDDNFEWHFKHYGTAQTRISWGVAHRSFGQHKGEGLYAVAFRGTSMESLQSLATNWMTNLKLYGWNLDGMVVHGGFMEALRPHMDELLAELKQASHGHTRLLVTGHSLGGGLANLFAYFAIKAMPLMKIELITAGSPRVGDTKFANFLEQRARLIYRVAGWCDPIPRTPDMLYHEGEDTIMGIPTTIPVLHAGPQVTVAANATSSETDCRLRMATMEDHSISLYIERVRQGLEGADDSLCHTTDVKNTLLGLVMAV